MNLLFALLLISQPAACRDPVIAEQLCDRAYQLYDVSTSLEKQNQKLSAENRILEEKLAVKTSTTNMHVVTETKEVSPWIWVITSGSGLLVGLLSGLLLF